MYLGVFAALSCGSKRGFIRGLPILGLKAFKEGKIRVDLSVLLV